MILEKRYPYGGKETRYYGAFTVDKSTGTSGFRLGYVPKDYRPIPGEAVIIPLTEMRTFCDDLGIDFGTEKKESWRLKLAKRIAGNEFEKTSIDLIEDIE